MENKKYLTDQVLTYIGNKRSLLDAIESQVVFVKKELGKSKLRCADLFSGSGVVSRMFKGHSSFLVANDLEDYSFVLNRCFLMNRSSFDITKYIFERNRVLEKAVSQPIEDGFVSRLYAPKRDEDIQMGERVFYTRENAVFIDSFRYYLDFVESEDIRNALLALLLVESSIHVNTCGVFKGFYKDRETGRGKFGGTAENALSRIKGKITIGEPVLSLHECEYRVEQNDAVRLAGRLPYMDLVYLDPPYNQHPYGSNYFMLNLLARYKEPTFVSKVSGIPSDWNRSVFNAKKTALNALEEVVRSLNCSFVLISYNNEGFIGQKEMESMLSQYGHLRLNSVSYPTFRGSHNLRNRDLHTEEFLFLLDKRCRK